ncbi:MAG: type VI secretion system baseplate subunit TssE [Rhodocyclaceae bacterium]|nr:type VI secretion system baseplate subunit TssE [Rhodocyclaceae bacterium]MBX3668200.1 type VI secretion system baseplate subunit TssE [Rhodocyclaceae bacterium]
MSEVLRDRLVPSLLDRLTDTDPSKTVEARDGGMLTLSQLRACVLRDLNWLFNASRLEDAEALDEKRLLSRYPNVQRSVVNFGLPALTGHTASGLNMTDVEQSLREAILIYEPRLIADTLVVKSVVEGDDMGNHNVIAFQIEASLWAQPTPMALLIHTELDLESGQSRVTESKPRR